MKKLVYKIAQTQEEFELYNIAYLNATKGEFLIDPAFLQKAYKVVYVVEAQRPNLIVAGFVINSDCVGNCRYLSLVSEETRSDCLKKMRLLNVFLPDLVECVAIFATKRLNFLDRVNFFIRAIKDSKATGKKATLAGSFIPQFRVSLHSVYHTSLYEGLANNGKFFGLYVDYNASVIQHLFTAVPLYLVHRFNNQTSKIAIRINSLLF
jgi:hypothetical protein